MLSLILKPLLKNLDSSIELPFDTEISLSMIESGCIFVLLDQKAVLIIKSTSEKIKELNNINGISLNFELIERPEFPSVGMHLTIKTVSNNEFNFDYFFNTDSHQELDLLQKLKQQDHFDMLLFCTEVVHIKRIDFGKNDKLELNSMIDKVVV